MTANELTARETGTVVPVHPNLGNMTLNTYSYPGNTYIDADSKTLTYYDSKNPGTLRMARYSEEYRLQQLRASLRFASPQPHPRSKHSPPRDPTKQDHRATSTTSLDHSFYTGGSRQKQIDYICMGLNKSKYDAASRFPDMNKVGCVSSYFFHRRAVCRRRPVQFRLPDYVGWDVSSSCACARNQ
ncbi:hypothetical protein BJX70DRAFT_404309 [Aspergillus crustosus]